MGSRSGGGRTTAEAFYRLSRFPQGGRGCAPLPAGDRHGDAQRGPVPACGLESPPNGAAPRAHPACPRSVPSLASSRAPRAPGLLPGPPRPQRLRGPVQMAAWGSPATTPPTQTLRGSGMAAGVRGVRGRCPPNLSTPASDPNPDVGTGPCSRGNVGSWPEPAGGGVLLSSPLHPEPPRAPDSTGCSPPASEGGNGGGAGRGSRGEGRVPHVPFPLVGLPWSSSQASTPRAIQGLLPRPQPRPQTCLHRGAAACAPVGSAPAGPVGPQGSHCHCVTTWGALASGRGTGFQGRGESGPCRGSLVRLAESRTLAGGR